MICTAFGGLLPTIALANDHYEGSAQVCRAFPADTEILWFARTIFSETKRVEEMRLVGWVIRNRVDTQYRGDGSYEAVVKSKHQFSGLSPHNKHYEFISNLSYGDPYPAWQNALAIAREIYHAPASARPFPAHVRHFYSPISVNRTPAWTTDGTVHTVIADSADDPARFAFYAGVR